MRQISAKVNQITQRKREAEYRPFLSISHLAAASRRVGDNTKRRRVKGAGGVSFCRELRSSEYVVGVLGSDVMVTICKQRGALIWASESIVAETPHIESPHIMMSQFYFDFSSTSVGVGIICSNMVNISLPFGAVISWEIMWPLIEHKKGDWYNAELSTSDLHGGFYCYCHDACFPNDNQSSKWTRCTEKKKSSLAVGLNIPSKALRQPFAMYMAVD
ncbi:hypothetical protein FH972_008730 [Carpinus fangiana]|uniref:Uncharacterized protein n=1 Tax=Carpinus fangiana TaxID=176857 RepID=A0A5N6R177_9ROSI|nr:hypothetical protein FH972_008730 [Carpinus fangiana]